MSEKVKRKSFSLADKLKIIQKFEGGMTKASISRTMGIPKSTIIRICQDKEGIKSQNVQFNADFKKVRKCQFPKVDSCLLEWFKLQRSRHIPVNGPLLQEKAKEFASLDGIPNFEASNGWLDSWKKRHGITFKLLSGESSAVDTTRVTSWLEDDWPRLRDSYLDKDIFNADETGLFYRLLPDKTHEYKKQTCFGGKKSKERLSVLLCANATGSDKLKPLVIGKSAKPRCFSAIKNLASLPVTYRSNKSAWMTSQIFEEWLRTLDRDMRLQNRKILLLIDSCPPHVAAVTQFPNVNVVFLPVNATSIVQPLDRGIINSFKVKYRSTLVRKIIAKLDDDLDPKIDVLEAIYGMSRAWREVTDVCIQNCFKNAKIIKTCPQLNNDEIEVEEVNEIPLAAIRNHWNLDSFNIQEYAEVDNDVAVFSTPSDAEIYASQTSERMETDVEEPVDATENDFERVTITDRVALQFVEDLKFYLTCNEQCNTSMFTGLENMERWIVQKKVTKLRQGTIDDYFAPHP
ncbi:Tigger transposable element-derived protein 6 [Orchesella cincta]|uniref:Tigger transposable element-derived protein 6 n=1 Tax=Orchesella cincta TaxID=48709 RepID=A0A1D2M783_ORCCI|nr:Tigger transposable element-derived protein 6 [Orchesella cincta]